MAYQYTPLGETDEEIGLLCLLPGKSADAIHILIEHVAFTGDLAILRTQGYW